MTIEIIYQDETIIAINKPPALLSVPGIGPEKQDCAISRLLKIEPAAKVIHRLDCFTSGLMIFGIGIESQRALNKLFHDRKIHKEYIALVPNWFDENTGVIKFPIRCDIDNRPVQIVDYTQGKSAVTYWQVLDRTKQCTRLLLKPETGRTHQLRVHCAAMQHPIIGDTLYGDKLKPQPRMMLHADKLHFIHPFKNNQMTLSAVCDF